METAAAAAAANNGSYAIDSLRKTTTTFEANPTGILVQFLNLNLVIGKSELS